MFVIIWKYKVRAGLAVEFEAMYGPRGDWAIFFGGGEGYLGSELLRPSEDEWYATIDRWESRESYVAFAQAHRDRYDAIDARCETLTVEERKLGEFETKAER